MLSAPRVFSAAHHRIHLHAASQSTIQRPHRPAYVPACRLPLHETSQVQLVVPPSYSRSGTSAARSFAFHACLGPASRQADVLRLCGITQLLDAALDGYNATIMAYGQTGSGKTFTMSGALPFGGGGDLCVGPGGGATAIPHFKALEGHVWLPALRAGLEDPQLEGGDGDGGIIARACAYLFDAAGGGGGLSRRDNGCRYRLERMCCVCVWREGGAPCQLARCQSALKRPPAAPSPPRTPSLHPRSLRASFSEIYNEQIYDLVRFDRKQQQVVDVFGMQ